MAEGTDYDITVCVDSTVCVSEEGVENTFYAAD